MFLDKFLLNEKVAIVTGAGRGIGKVIAKVFAEAGAHVVCTARTRDQIEATATEIISLGQHAMAIPGDVTQAEQVKKLVHQTREAFGRIDILINNAAGGSFTTMMEIDEAAFESDLRVGVTSVFMCSQAVAKVMLEQKEGCIVNISSRESQIPSLGLPAYGVAKAGVNSVTRTLAWELAPYVRVNAILPGPVLTETTALFPKEVHDQVARAVPLKRWGQPEDVALAALYLASPASEWVTGRMFEIDGGIEFSHLASDEMTKI